MRTIYTRGTNGVSDRAEGALGQKIRVHLGDRRCPLCQAQAWDFAGTRVVFLVEAERVRLEKIQDHLERTGSRLYREHPGIPAGRAIA